MSQPEDERRERRGDAAKTARERARGPRPSGGARTRTGGGAGARTHADPPDTSAALALARARGHARAALAEAILALRALVDAASFAATGEPSSAHPALGRLTRAAEELAAALGADGAAPDALVDAIAQALDAEIRRWEARAHDDPDARAVLRAYLGLREMLWELGVRRAPEGSRAAADAGEGRHPGTRARTGGTPARGANGSRRRLERVPLG